MSLDLKRIQALCFDVDGTLSDTDDQYVLKLAGWLKPGAFLFRRRDPALFARWAVMRTQRMGNWLRSVPDRFGVDAPLASLNARFGFRKAGEFYQPFLLIPGIREFLSALQTRYPLAIISARGQLGTQNFLDQFELNAYFQCVATAQTCRYTKPFPDPILWAAGQMGVLPQACVMIGDTYVDIRAGKAAGAQTVGVLCGFGGAAELRWAGADLILEKTTDLLKILEQDSAPNN